MIPIRDDNPVRGLPVVTVFLILTCMGVYLWQLSLPPEGRQEATTLLGFMPGVLFGYARIEGDPWVSPAGSIFTAMFLHGGFFHLAANVLYLWIFGDNVEDRVGRGRFVAFYVICGARRGALSGPARRAVDGADGRGERCRIGCARRATSCCIHGRACSSRCRSC